ncbi:MAG TPA: protein kinase, partial [Myxococcota bacterium]
MATDSPDLLARIDDLERSQREPLPRTFGPYLLVRSLAKGGMGEVFFAKSGAVQGFEKHCVVKTLRPHLTDDREYVARFIDEARVVVQLNHKNVCQVFDVGLVGERYYLAMELIAGQDLRSLADAMLAKGRPFPTGLALHIVAETLEALDYAHRKLDVAGNPLHLVHRDISPQNVMISYEGEVKLIDFGLAASAVKLEKTSPNLVMGKLAYMSVEQIRGEVVDRGVDLFATAVMLTELLLGERYYAGLTPHETWTLAAKGSHRPARYRELDADMRAILDRALHVDKAERYPDGLAFRQALMDWRAKHNFWADGPALRNLMQEVFGEQLLEHHLLLQDTARLVRPSLPPVSLEQSRSLLRSASGEALLSGPNTAAPLLSAFASPSTSPGTATLPSSALEPVTSALPLATTEPSTTIVPSPIGSSAPSPTATPTTFTALSAPGAMSRPVTEATGAVVTAAFGGPERTTRAAAIVVGLLAAVVVVFFAIRGPDAPVVDDVVVPAAAVSEKADGAAADVAVP